jgi:hypothetical protein
MPRHHGQRPAGGRLGGDHPERLRERAGHDHRVCRGEQIGEFAVIEPAGPDDPVAQAGGRGVPRRERVDVGGQPGQLGPGLGPQGANRVQIPGLEIDRQPLQPFPKRPEPDHDQPRRRHAGQDERPGRK